MERGVQYFSDGAAYVMRRWPILVFAHNQSTGGSDTEEKIKFFIQEVITRMLQTASKSVDVYANADFMYTYIENELNISVDDHSVEDTCTILSDFMAQCKLGNGCDAYETMKMNLEGVEAKIQKLSDDDSSSEESSEDEERPNTPEKYEYFEDSEGFFGLRKRED